MYSLEQLLFELFKIMFNEETGLEYDQDYIEKTEIDKYIYSNMEITTKVLMLEALVKEYICINKFK